MTDILLDAYKIPQRGKVELQIDRSFEINITAEEARRQVNRWLLNEVSYLIKAEVPTLVIGEQSVIWRVPASISFPHTGPAGLVGIVKVNVQTGEMDDLAQCQREIEHNLAKLKPIVPSYKPRTPEESSDYLAKKIPLAPKLVIAESGDLKVISQIERSRICTGAQES